MKKHHKIIVQVIPRSACIFNGDLLSIPVEIAELVKIISSEGWALIMFSFAPNLINNYRFTKLWWGLILKNF